MVFGLNHAWVYMCPPVLNPLPPPSPPHPLWVVPEHQV